MLQQKNEMPARSTLIVWAEFIELTGTTPERLHELVDMAGHTHPVPPTPYCCSGATIFTVSANWNACAPISSCIRSAVPLWSIFWIVLMPLSCV